MVITIEPTHTQISLFGFFQQPAAILITVECLLRFIGEARKPRILMFGEKLDKQSVDTKRITFVTGGSGFTGSRIIQSSNSNIRALVHNHEVAGSNITKVYGSLFDGKSNFRKWLHGVNYVIHAARPSSGKALGRYFMANRTRKAVKSMISVIEESSVSSTIVLHGSLSYGDRGEEIVETDSKLNPKGYSKAYSIGEKPWIEYLEHGGDVKIVRCPWILGPGSWFNMLYAGDTIPIIDGGRQWMSLVSINSLSDFVWSLFDQKPGIFHPSLTYRCRQADFARLVAEARGMDTTSVSKSELIKKYGRMVTESLLCSIRVDDSRGVESESDLSMQNIGSYLHSLSLDSKI